MSFLLAKRKFTTSLIKRVMAMNPEVLIDETGVVSKLNNKSIISIRGENTSKFLQGLVSNDMRLFDNNPNRAAIYSCFLNTKGRIGFDSFIAKPKLGMSEKD